MSERRMATPTKVKVNLPSVFGYLTFVALAAGASFVSRTSFAPHLVFNYIALVFPSDTRLSAFLAILALGVLGGLIVGISFGILLGFMALSRPVAKAFWISVGTVVFSMLFWIPIVKVGTAGGLTTTQAWSMFVEALAFVGTLCLVTGVTDQLTSGMKLKVRMICVGVGLLLALLLYRDIFLTYLPGVFEWLRCGMGGSGFTDCIKMQIEAVREK